MKTLDDLVFGLEANAEELETQIDGVVIEETLLAGLLDPTVAPKILEATRPTDFEFDRHREAAAVFFRLAGEGRHIDPVTFRDALIVEHGEAFVANSLPDPEADLSKLVAFAADVMTQTPPSKGQVLAYLDIFARRAAVRQFRHMASKTLEAVDKGKLTPQSGAADVLKLVAGLEATQRLAGTARTEGEELDAYFADLEARQGAGHDFTGLDTGFAHLNRVINGLGAGLYVLAAVPSAGKTTFAKQIADTVVERHPDAACLFVSLEQSKGELRVKTLARLSGVENRDLQRGRLDTSSPAWKRVVEAKEVFADFADRLQVMEGDSLTTVDRVRLAAIQLRQKTEAARLLIVVDYLQVLPADKDFREPRQRVDFVVSELRRLARDLDAPVIAISAMSRTAYRDAKLDAFKESGGIEYGADVALIMANDPDKATGEEHYLGVMRRWRKVFLDVVKNRNGERARIEIKFFPAVSRFSEGAKSSLPED